MHLGQLSTNDSWSPRVSEHDGEEGMDLSSSVIELYFREGGHVLAKIAGYTLKRLKHPKKRIIRDIINVSFSNSIFELLNLNVE